jgi:hypothetical protein
VPQPKQTGPQGKQPAATPNSKKALLTLDDVAEARDAWHRDAPQRYRRLLDAAPAGSPADRS